MAYGGLNAIHDLIQEANTDTSTTVLPPNANFNGPLFLDASTTDYSIAQQDAINRPAQQVYYLPHDQYVQVQAQLGAYFNAHHSDSGFWSDILNGFVIPAAEYVGPTLAASMILGPEAGVAELAATTALEVAATDAAATAGITAAQVLGGVAVLLPVVQAATTVALTPDGSPSPQPSGPSSSGSGAPAAATIPASAPVATPSQINLPTVSIPNANWLTQALQDLNGAQNAPAAHSTSTAADQPDYTILLVSALALALWVALRHRQTGGHR